MNSKYFVLREFQLSSIGIGKWNRRVAAGGQNLKLTDKVIRVRDVKPKFLA